MSGRALAGLLKKLGGAGTVALLGLCVAAAAAVGGEGLEPPEADSARLLLSRGVFAQGPGGASPEALPPEPLYPALLGLALALQGEGRDARPLEAALRLAAAAALFLSVLAASRSRLAAAAAAVALALYSPPLPGSGAAAAALLFALSFSLAARLLAEHDSDEAYALAAAALLLAAHASWPSALLLPAAVWRLSSRGSRPWAAHGGRRVLAHAGFGALAVPLALLARSGLPSAGGFLPALAAAAVLLWPSGSRARGTHAR